MEINLKGFVALLIGFALMIPAMAQDRSEVVAHPELVRPLLNGEFVPDVVVQTEFGGDIRLRDLVEKKPSLILFYRGGWCPYCSRQLSGMIEVEQRILNLGYQIIAISPDTPQRLAAQKSSNEFDVIRLSDNNLTAIRAFGLAYFLEDKVAAQYRGKLGAELATLDGTEKVVLPVPAAYIIDDTGLVQFQYVNPNYKVRVSPHLLFQAARIARQRS